MMDRCPCCSRAFERMQDYPRVLVRRVEMLSLPEVIDYWSDEAAMESLKRRRTSNDDPSDQGTLTTGINRTPETAEAYQSQVVRTYLRTLAGHEGQEIAPEKLAPGLEPDRYFRWAYPIPGTRLYIALSEAESEGEERVCQVTLHGKGPNLGSAGGPTLQPFGAVASIYYKGRLMAPKG